MDKVRVQGLQVYGHHGVFPEERVLGQVLVVDLEVGCDLQAAGLTDDLNHSISYVDLVAIARDVVQHTDYQLLEAIAEDIARRVLALERASTVSVRIEKPRAPIPDLTGTVSIEITRQKG